MVLNSKNECSAGFTILEVLITLAILSLVVMSATKLLSSNVQAVQRMDQSVEYTQNLRIATNQILDKIKKENSVKVEVDNTLLKLDDKPVLDINDNTTSNTANAELWLYKKGENNYELRDKANKVIAEYIESIVLEEPSGKPYVNIEISVVDTELATLSIPKTFAFASVPSDPNAIWQRFVTFSHRLDIEDGTITGSSTIVYVKNRNDESFKVFNSNTKIETAEIYIEKNLHLRDAWLGKSDGTTSVYVDGNITFDNQAQVLGTLYHTGNTNRSIPNAVEVDSIDFPTVTMPPPQSDNWYIERGFTNNATPRDGMKYKGGSITFDNVQVSDVCIYVTGKSTITLQNSQTNVSGILYAPGGSVIVRSGSTFNGVIIADRLRVENSNTTVNYVPFNTADLPF